MVPCLTVKIYIRMIQIIKRSMSCDVLRKHVRNIIKCISGLTCCKAEVQKGVSNSNIGNPRWWYQQQRPPWRPAWSTIQIYPSAEVRSAGLEHQGNSLRRAQGLRQGVEEQASNRRQGYTGFQIIDIFARQRTPTAVWVRVIRKHPVISPGPQPSIGPPKGHLLLTDMNLDHSQDRQLWWLSFDIE